MGRRICGIDQVGLFRFLINSSLAQQGFNAAIFSGLLITIRNVTAETRNITGPSDLAQIFRQIDKTQLVFAMRSLEFNM